MKRRKIKFSKSKKKSEEGAPAEAVISKFHK